MPLYCGLETADRQRSWNEIPPFLCSDLRLQQWKYCWKRCFQRDPLRGCITRSTDNWATLFLWDRYSGTWPSRLGESRIWDSKIWSRVPRDSDPRMTALARSSSNCKRQTRSLVRESAPHQQACNCLTVRKIWSGCSPPRQTGRLTVGRNKPLTLTLTLTLTSIQLVSAVQLSTVEWSETVGEQWVELSQFGPCEPLLLEAGSWGTGRIREPRVRRTSAAGSRYQTTTGEDTADWKDLVRAVVNCRVCELVLAL
jgi:hypothetical protein